MRCMYNVGGKQHTHLYHWRVRCNLFTRFIDTNVCFNAATQHFLCITIAGLFEFRTNWGNMMENYIVGCHLAIVQSTCAICLAHFRFHIVVVLWNGCCRWWRWWCRPRRCPLALHFPSTMFGARNFGRQPWGELGQ